MKGSVFNKKPLRGRGGCKTKDDKDCGVRSSRTPLFRLFEPFLFDERISLLGLFPEEVDLVPEFYEQDEEDDDHERDADDGDRPCVQGLRLDALILTLASAS